MTLPLAKMILDRMPSFAMSVVQSLSRWEGVKVGFRGTQLGLLVLNSLRFRQSSVRK